MRRAVALLALLLFASPDALARGGAGASKKTTKAIARPYLPYYPYVPRGRSNDWYTWWSYNQHQYVDYRRRQRERKGAISGKGGAAAVDPDAWRDELRRRLVPVLKQALDDPDREVRAAAAMSLGKVRALDAVDQLKRAYARDRDQYVRDSALKALLLMRDPTLAEFFMDLATRKAERLLERGMALLGLGNLGNTPARDFLLGVLEPKTPHAKAVLPTGAVEKRQFRIAALAGLQLTGHEENAALLLRIAKSKKFHEDVRAYACDCLGKLEARGAYLELLRLVTRAHSAQVRRSAVVAVGAIAPRESPDAIKVLVPALYRDKDPIVRHFAAVALGRVGGDVAFRKLKRHFQNANRETRGFYLLGVGLTKHAEAPAFLKRELATFSDAWEACPAAIGFALLEDPRHTPLVRETFQASQDIQLREACMVALGMLNDRGSEPLLEKLIKERERPELLFGAVRAYALIRQHKAVPLLLGVFEEEADLYLMRAFIQSMAFLSSQRAAAPLEKIYRDERLPRDVRAYALYALGTLADTSDYPLLVRLAFHTNYFVRCEPLDAILGTF